MRKKIKLYGEGWRYLRGGDSESASDAATCVLFTVRTACSSNLWGPLLFNSDRPSSSPNE